MGCIQEDTRKFLISFSGHLWLVRQRAVAIFSTKNIRLCSQRNWVRVCLFGDGYFLETAALCELQKVIGLLNQKCWFFFWHLLTGDELHFVWALWIDVMKVCVELNCIVRFMYQPRMTATKWMQVITAEKYIREEHTQFVLQSEHYHFCCTGKKPVLRKIDVFWESFIFPNWGETFETTVPLCFVLRVRNKENQQKIFGALLKVCWFLRFTSNINHSFQ